MKPFRVTDHQPSKRLLTSDTAQELRQFEDVVFRLGVEKFGNAYRRNWREDRRATGISSWRPVSKPRPAQRYRTVRVLLPVLSTAIRPAVTRNHHPTSTFRYCTELGHLLVSVHPMMLEAVYPHFEPDPQ